MTQLASDSRSLAHVIRLACHIAECPPDKIACIHAHGTATLSNDLAEARAFQLVFGKNINEIPIVSQKGSIGHLLGAAGAVETAIAALSCNKQRSPGISTLIEPDAELCHLFFPNKAIGLKKGSILKTSLGFGGHLAAIILDLP